jgi:hypothetical protein
MSGSRFPHRLAALALLLASIAGVWILVAAEPADSPVSPQCAPETAANEVDLPTGEKWRTDPNVFIAHGGGGIDGRTYTDSLEAVTASIRRGYRMIELDLLVTTDGHIVAAHDWKSLRQRTGEGDSASDQPMSLAAFRKRRIDGRFTPLDEQTIRRIFAKHPDLILVTDKIRDFTRLVRAFPFQDRVIVEVFSPREFYAAMTAGIANPMLSISRIDASLDFVLGNPVRLVALPVGELERCASGARRILASGRRVFAFTTDDATLIRRHAGVRASAFYSDFWNVAAGVCDGEACRRGIDRGG